MVLSKSQQQNILNKELQEIGKEAPNIYELPN
jgi:hypothetical protein